MTDDDLSHARGGYDLAKLAARRSEADTPAVLLKKLPLLIKNLKAAAAGDPHRAMTLSVDYLRLIIEMLEAAPDYVALADRLADYANGDEFQRPVEEAERVIRALAQAAPDYVAMARECGARIVMDVPRDLDTPSKPVDVQITPDQLAAFAARISQAAPVNERALRDAAERTVEVIERQLNLIAERAPGEFLDKRPVVQSLKAHIARLRAALSAAPSPDREDAFIAAVRRMREWQKQAPGAAWAKDALEASEAFVDAALSPLVPHEPAMSEEPKTTITLTERTPLDKAMYIADRYAGGKHDDALRVMLEQAIVDYGAALSVAPAQAAPATDTDAQLEELLDALDANAQEPNTQTYDRVSVAKGVARNVMAAPAAVSVAPSQDREDAARYRWLREQLLAADFMWGDPPQPVLVFMWPSDVAVGGNCDQNIDAAIAARQAPKEQP